MPAMMDAQSILRRSEPLVSASIPQHKSADASSGFLPAASFRAGNSGEPRKSTRWLSALLKV